MKQVCSRCGDTGRVYIPVDMDGVGRTYFCNCPVGKDLQAEEGKAWHRRMFEQSR